MMLTLDQMATPHFVVSCRCPGGVFMLTSRGTWTHESTNIPAAVFDSRLKAWRALQRAYKHRDDTHEVVQVSGFRPPR